MLARLHLFLPFEIICPEHSEYKIYSYQVGEYGIQFTPPRKSDKPPRLFDPETILLSGKPAFQADILEITFMKADFERSTPPNSKLDPPAELIQSAIDSYLTRARYILRAPQIRSVPLVGGQWNLTYLKDDGNELEKEAGKFRSRNSRNFGLTFLRADPPAWDAAFSLPFDFKPPVWRDMLIDAKGALPHIGTAIALAAISLEIFVSEILNNNATASKVSPELWTWINDRGNWQKEPSVEEQYDVLLKIILGHSLKEAPTLWKGYKDLKSARNSFVHQGIAKIGTKIIDQEMANALIKNAEEITALIRTWLPIEQHWPEIGLPNVTLEFRKKIARNMPPQDSPEAQS